MADRVMGYSKSAGGHFVSGGSMVTDSHCGGS